MIKKLFPIILFIIKFHIYYWYKCEDPLTAPSLDLKMIKLSLKLPQLPIPSCPEIQETEENDDTVFVSENDQSGVELSNAENNILEKTLQTIVTDKLFELSYYLNVHLVPLALFDPTITFTVKNKIAKNIKNVEGSKKENDRFHLKPVSK